MKRPAGGELCPGQRFHRQDGDPLLHFLQLGAGVRAAACLLTSTNGTATWRPWPTPALRCIWPLGTGTAYYGPASLEKAYADLHSLYERQGLTDSAIDQLLVLDVRGEDFFSSHGFSDQHAGGQAFAHDPAVMGWLFSH